MELNARKRPVATDSNVSGAELCEWQVSASEIIVIGQLESPESDNCWCVVNARLDQFEEEMAVTQKEIRS